MDSNYNRSLKRLKQDFERDEHFALFIGAGINTGNNVKLSWYDLIKVLCKSSLRQIFQKLKIDYSDTKALFALFNIADTEDFQNPKEWNGLKNYISANFPVEVIVSIIKSLLGDSYITALQSYIYGQCNKSVIKKSFEYYKLDNEGKISAPGELYTLYVIARMILLNPQIKAIITYNYDNFLSLAIREMLGNVTRYFTQNEIAFIKARFNHTDNEHELIHTVRIIDIHDNGNPYDLQGQNVIPIYHVHGYIPPYDEMQLIDTTSIVLSLDEFCERISQSATWQDAVQIHYLKHCHCLFAGSSMTDLTIKRLINHAHSHKYKKHIYALDAFTVSEAENNFNHEKQALHKIKSHYLESQGVTLIDCDKGFAKLYSDIATINRSQINTHTL